jgi:hypothetical protein
VLATDIFFAIVGAQLDPGRAASLGLLLLMMAFGAFIVQRRFIGEGGYTTVSGKGDSGLPLPLPPHVRKFAIGIATAVADPDADRLRVRVLRQPCRDLGARQLADLAALREGVRSRLGGRRTRLERRGVELVLDDDQAVADLGAADRGGRPADSRTCWRG